MIDVYIFFPFGGRSDYQSQRRGAGAKSNFLPETLGQGHYENVVAKIFPSRGNVAKADRWQTSAEAVEAEFSLGASDSCHGVSSKETRLSQKRDTCQLLDHLP